LDPIVEMIKDFLDTSKCSINGLLGELRWNSDVSKKERAFFVIEKGKRIEKRIDGTHFFLRTSTEFSSPQLTLEEVQGIIAARLLETCCNYLEANGDRNLEKDEWIEIAENLRKPPSGKIMPFILNVDDTEPDRYSNNPFRASIVESGQSAFPVANVKTSSLKVDPKFVAKYLGSLISSEEIDFIEHQLYTFDNYIDLVEFMKYDSLEKLKETIGIDLCIPNIRMPLENLMHEKTSDPLHLIIQGSHKDYDTIERIYELMGRSIKKKTTLLTVPHSLRGYGSKRSAKGKLVFDGQRLKQVDVTYRTIKLYPNMVDPNDLSIAKAEDFISIDAEDLIHYDYHKTPSTPQFALYVLDSPEQASIAHGAGAYAGSKILKSYWSIFEAYVNNRIMQEIPEKNIQKAPLVLNLVPEKMWLHSKYENIDASAGCIPDFTHFLKEGVAVEKIDF